MEHVRKPEWLKIQIGANARYADTKRIVDTHKLHTICSSGRCPNLGECWGKGTATFMIGGAICTRSCKFCNTQSGKPLPLAPEEPRHVAESIRLMKLDHAVITSVDRDDLPDLGAAHWAETIRCIKEMNPDTTLETLIPDFQGRPCVSRYHFTQSGNRKAHHPAGAECSYIRTEPASDTDDSRKRNYGKVGHNGRFRRDTGRSRTDDG